MFRKYPETCWLFILLLAGMAQPALGQSLQEVRNRFLAPIVMEGLDPNSPEAKAAVAGLDRSVAQLLATQIVEPGAPGFGGWDPELSIKSKEICYNGTFFRRTLRLARAWACPASKYYQSPEVATALERAMQYVLPMLEAHKRPGNWWAWDIGIPNRLGETLICAGDALSPEVRERAVREQVHLTKQKQLASRGGANTAWRAMVQMRTALVTGDPIHLDRASATMSKLLEANDAIQPDYSYFFHGPGLNIGYGFAHWDAACHFARAADGTRWALTPTAAKNLVDWTREFFCWNAWRGMWSPWSTGRARTRPYGVDDGMAIMRPTITMDALSIARPLMELANVDSWPPPQREALLAVAAEHVGGPASDSDDPAPYYLMRASKTGKGKSEYGTKYFPYTDYLVARRPGWYAAVRLGSVRTKTWFTLARENLLGHEQAEGSLALMTEPEDCGYDVLVTMPYDDLAGVTRQKGLQRKHDAKGQSKQTGGVTLGGVGLAGFDYELTGEGRSLRANKSYLMLPGAIVLMGSAIKSEGPGAVCTTLAQVRRRDGDGQWLAGGAAKPWDDGTAQVAEESWLRLGDVGVVPLQPMDLSVAVQTITAQSERINQLYTTDETYTNQFGGVRVDHGTGPTDGSYAAVLLPDASPADVAAFAAKPTVTLLANRDEVHAVRTADGLLAAAFFAPGRVDTVVAADGPLYLLAKPEANGTKLTVMAPPSDKFGDKVVRELWVAGQFDRGTLPSEVLDRQDVQGGISLKLRLETGRQFTLTLPRGPSS